MGAIHFPALIATWALLTKLFSQSWTELCFVLRTRLVAMHNSARVAQGPGRKTARWTEEECVRFFAQWDRDIGRWGININTHHNAYLLIQSFILFNQTIRETDGQVYGCRWRCERRWWTFWNYLDFSINERTDESVCLPVKSCNVHCKTKTKLNYWGKKKL